MVSIHALLAECDVRLWLISRFLYSFNPRTPCGVRPLPFWKPYAPLRFQSTHSLRSATKPDSYRLSDIPVSIHALLAECDGKNGRTLRRMFGFNPRTPCGVRPGLVDIEQMVKEFQSTHSLRSATSDFIGQLFPFWVSIHALLAECDPQFAIIANFFSCFNPRTPCGVRLIQVCFQHGMDLFQSTHSLRSATRVSIDSNDYPAFQSTHSLRSATDDPHHYSPGTLVSIHALLAECDFFSDIKKPSQSGFNPRTPCGVRRIFALHI